MLHDVRHQPPRPAEADTKGRRVADLRDPLSGLVGRDAFVALAHSRLGRQLLSASALTMIQIDYFDFLLGRYGADCGDMVIRGVAQALQRIVRDRDVVGRIDDTTFAVLHAEIDVVAVREVGERLRRTVQALAFYGDDGASIPVTVSIGIDAVVGTGRTASPDLLSVMARASGRLEAARDAGCNRVVAPPAIG